MRKFFGRRLLNALREATHRLRRAPVDQVRSFRAGSAEGVGFLLPLEAFHSERTRKWQKEPDPVARSGGARWMHHSSHRAGGGELFLATPSQSGLAAG